MYVGDVGVWFVREEIACVHCWSAFEENVYRQMLYKMQLASCNKQLARKVITTTIKHASCKKKGGVMLMQSCQSRRCTAQPEL
jgi:hypothetical protein